MKLASTPLAIHFKLSMHLCPSTKKEEAYISNTMSCLIYAKMCSGYDIAHVVDVVSKDIENP